jgi:cell division protein FtsA
MSSNEQVFVGLDVGTSKVACVVGVMEQDALQPSVIAASLVRNFGVRKGAVADVEETATAIGTAVEEVTHSSGYQIEGATVSVGGAHLRSINSKGVIAVGGVNRAITADDVTRAEEAATVIQLPPNREIIQVFARHYRLDGQESLKDPVGMSGVRLEVDAHIITASTPAVRNLQKSIYQAGLTVHQQEAPALAAARVVLDKRQREHGTALIDIGAGTTNIVVFEEGEILHTATLGLGSSHITNDLAIGFRTDLDSAELIKCQHTDLSAQNRQHGATVKTASGEILAIDLAYAITIARARLEEIFELVRHELEKTKRLRKLPGGAVLVGGGSRQKGIVTIAKDILDLPVALGTCHGFSGLTDKVSDPRYGVALGLMCDDILTSQGSLSGLAGLATTRLSGAAKNVLRFLRP